MKKTWDQPELVVLVKGRTHEAVLDHCKTSALGSGSGNGNQACGTFGSTNCSPCADRGGVHGS